MLTQDAWFITNKHRKNFKKLHQEHLMGCRGVKVLLLKDVTITTINTVNVTSVTHTINQGSFNHVKVGPTPVLALHNL